MTSTYQEQRVRVSYYFAGESWTQTFNSELEADHRTLWLVMNDIPFTKMYYIGSAGNRRGQIVEQWGEQPPQTHNGLAP